MPLELDPQSLKEYLQKAIAWVRANPIPTALAGGVLFTVLLFTMVVSSLLKDNVTEEKVSLAEDEMNLCTRLRKLEQLEPSLQKRGMNVELSKATGKIFTALLGEAPSPDDLALLDQAQRECSGMQNHDFSWLLAIDARVRKGVWPGTLTLPPTSSALRDRFSKAIEKVPTAAIALPTDAASLDAWFVFAAGEAPVMEPLLEAWLRASGAAGLEPLAKSMRIYQTGVRLTPKSTLIESTFNKLGLLRKPIYVVDVLSPPAPQPASAPASQPVLTAALGPQGTFIFLGVLAGDMCALAASKDPFPPLVERSCKGLVPRRLESGEIFLLPAQTRTSTRLLPVLMRDDGQLLVGNKTKDEVDPALLGTFVATAQANSLGKAQVGAITSVTEDGVELAFDTKPIKGAGIVGFSSTLPMTLEKKCPAMPKELCTQLKTENAKRCEIGATVCLTTMAGRTLRYGRTVRVETEPCIAEYGEKAGCPKTETVGLFVDVKEAGAADFGAATFHALSVTH